MFRETLNSLKQKKQIKDFEYPELIEFNSNGYIDYQKQIRQINNCKRLCLERLRELNSH